MSSVTAESWAAAVSSVLRARKSWNTFSIKTTQISSGRTPTAKNAAVSLRWKEERRG